MDEREAFEERERSVEIRGRIQGRRGGGRNHRYDPGRRSSRHDVAVGEDNYKTQMQKHVKDLEKGHLMLRKLRRYGTAYTSRKDEREEADQVMASCWTDKARIDTIVDMEEFNRAIHKNKGKKLRAVEGFLKMYAAARVSEDSVSSEEDKEEE